MTTGHIARIAAAVAVAGIILLGARNAATQSPPDIHVLASNGVKAVIEALQPQAERAVAHPLTIRFNSSSALKESIDAGEPFDVAIVTTEMMDQLIKERRIVAGTNAAIARSGIGVGIRAGAPKPDIRTPEALKSALLKAKAISYASDGASRPHIVTMLDRLGIADAVKSKTLLEQGSVRSAGRVAAGDADFVITLISEILPISGIELLGPLPAEFQSYVTLAAGVGAKAKNADAAKALVAYLSGPTTTPTLKAKGMEKPAPPGVAAIPRLSDGQPDLNGVWERPYVPDMTRTFRDQEGPAQLPYSPAGAEKFKNYDVSKFDYTGHCLPQGMTRSMNSPFPIEIIHTPKRVAILFEAWNVFHVIPTDGRTFPKDIEPTWIGTSIGHWEGDTLVVETRGFNGKTNVDTVGHQHSDKLRLTQRFTRTDEQHIAYEVLVDDPVVYTKPWKNTRTFTLRPDWELMEYSCMENNKDLLEGHIK